MSVKEAEEIKNIVWGSCLPTPGPRRKYKHKRVKLIGHPAFPDLSGAPFHRCQYLASPCLHLISIHHHRHPLRIPRGRQCSSRLRAALPAEIKLCNIFLLTHRARHKPNQVPGRCRPIERWPTLNVIPARAVLFERGSQRKGNVSLGECSKTPEKSKYTCTLLCDGCSSLHNSSRKLGHPSPFGTEV